MDKHILITNSDDWMNERKRQTITGQERDVYIKERLAAEFTMWVERRSLVMGFTVGLASGLAASVVIAVLAKSFL